MFGGWVTITLRILVCEMGRVTPKLLGSWRMESTYHSSWHRGHHCQLLLYYYFLFLTLLWEHYPMPKHRKLQKLLPGASNLLLLQQPTAGSQCLLRMTEKAHHCTRSKIKRVVFTRLCPQLATWPWTRLLLLFGLNFESWQMGTIKKNLSWPESSNEEPRRIG